MRCRRRRREDRGIRRRWRCRRGCRCRARASPRRKAESVAAIPYTLVSMTLRNAARSSEISAERAHADPGVGDDDIGRAESCGEIPGRLLHGGCVGDVDRIARALGVEPGEQRGDQRAASRAQPEDRALAGIVGGERRADAARRAGDEYLQGVCLSARAARATGCVPRGRVAPGGRGRLMTCFVPPARRAEREESCRRRRTSERRGCRSAFSSSRASATLARDFGRSIRLEEFLPVRCRCAPPSRP